MIVNHRGEQFIFKEHKNGLYYCDLKLIINKIKEGCSALQTAKELEKNTPNKTLKG